MAWLGPIQDGRQPQRWRHKEINFKAGFPHPLSPPLFPYVV